ncbi:tRNA synthetase class II core domain (G, h, p, S and t) domain-containing protein [Ditylenchus destructor]|nr:tRNA synthetase class II core domain (G, h, p, S and t) domain-containing protein [Ditylenchus destructor]
MVLNYASRMFFKLQAGNKKSKCLSFQFMIDNNLIHPVARGIYALLPLGQRTVGKLQQIIESQLIAVGAQKLESPILADKALWTKTERWDTMGSELFRLSDREKAEYCLQPTAEEMITSIVENFGNQRENAFPIMLFQSSQKFRDEPSPKYGLLRSRQFLMNDLYSYDCNETSAQGTYNLITSVYSRIFTDILQLKGVRRVEASSGLMGGNISHEYHLPNQSCEDRILVCKECESTKYVDAEAFATNEYQRSCEKCKTKYSIIDTVEIAHTFQLGTKYTLPFEAVSSTRQPLFMCCFGIGITRLIAASIDNASISDKAMRLPHAISPYKIALLLPKAGTLDQKWNFAQEVLEEMDKIPRLKGEIIVDDRCEKSIGRRLAEMNYLGIPHIFAVNTLKSEDPYGIPCVEYFRTTPGSDSLIEEKRLTHYDLMKLVRSF